MNNVINRHIWLIDLIATRDGITFEEINAQWQRATVLNPTEEPLPLRTFNNWKKDIRDEFGITLRCNRSNNRYYLEDIDKIGKQSIREWLLNAFTISNLLSQRDALEGRIMLENVPSGHTFLKPIVEAMKDNRRIRFHYRKFRGGAEQDVLFEPYCVKLHQRRWYVLGRNVDKQELRTYALDRFSTCTFTTETFQLPRDFSADAYYTHTYGVINDERVPDIDIRLRVYDTQRDYLRTLPLHPSQREVATTEEYSDFILHLRPTFDFIQNLLSQREFTEVLEPAALRQQISDILATMQRRYR